MEKCLKTLSEYRQRRCRCHVWWKTVPEDGARNWKSRLPTVERLNSGRPTASWLVRTAKKAFSHTFLANRTAIHITQYDRLLA